MEQNEVIERFIWAIGATMTILPIMYGIIWVGEKIYKKIGKIYKKIEKK